MSDLEPKINSIDPAQPIIIKIDPASNLGRSGPLTLKYSVTDNDWLEGRPDIPFKATLEAVNVPYHVVGGTPAVTKSETLTKQKDDFEFDFELETTAPINGSPFPVTLKLCVYDEQRGEATKKCDANSYTVKLQ